MAKEPARGSEAPGWARHARQLALLLLTSLAPLAAAVPSEDLSETDRGYYEAWGVSPDDPAAHTEYANQVARILDLRDATRHYEAALALDPDYPDAHFGYAMLLVRVKRVEEAIPHFQKVLGSGKPFESMAHSSLGRILGSLGKPEEALHHFEEAVRLRPDRPEAQFNLGLAYYHQNRLEGAAEHLQKAVELDPSLRRAHLRLGGVLRALGRNEESLTALRTLLRFNRRDPLTLYEIGLTFEALGDPAQARPTLEKALEYAKKSYRFRDLRKLIEERLAAL